MGPVAKMTLRPATGQPLVLPYNPEKLSMSSQANYKEIKNKQADLSDRQYLGRTTGSMTVEVRLDARALTRPVKMVVDMMFGWLSPSATSTSQAAPSPPIIAVSWGRARWFDVVLQSVDVDYTLFDVEGQPTRAVVQLTMQDATLKQKRQNPTSGSLVGRRSHQVVAGDSLHSIATAEYGSPRHWRDLALANGLDDPMALRPGTRLMLPAQADLPSQETEPSPW